LASPEINRCESVLRGGGFGNDVHTAALLVKQDLAIGERKQRPVAARADVPARNKLAAALADNDAAGGHKLAAKFFYTKAFADAVAPVLYAALTFFMCHKILSVDCGDFDDRQFLTMTDGLVITLAALHLERQLVLAALVFDDVRSDSRTGDGGRAHAQFAVVVDQQHAVKRDRLAGFNFKTFDFELVASDNPILLATCF